MRASRQKMVVVLVTCPSRASAGRLARRLVSRRLAACANILPGVTSLFWWEGRVDRCRETLLLLKTTAAGFDRLRRAVLALHPYDVPEIIALPVGGAHAPYRRWVASSVSPASRA
jgi:periplasmic divalent cation tolerance protein